MERWPSLANSSCRVFFGWICRDKWSCPTCVGRGRCGRGQPGTRCFLIGGCAFAEHVLETRSLSSSSSSSPRSQTRARTPGVRMLSEKTEAED